MDCSYQSAYKYALSMYLRYHFIYVKPGLFFISHYARIPRVYVLDITFYIFKYITALISVSMLVRLKYIS